jgi:hypothetical protein
VTATSSDNTRPADRPPTPGVGDANACPRRHGFRVSLRIGAAVAFGAWLAHYAYVRMITPAASYGRVHVPPEPTDERIAAELDDAAFALAAAIQSIPAIPAFDEPPPTAMRWMLPPGNDPDDQIADVLRGDWDPALRPNLRFAIRYLSTPAVTTALDRVCSLCETPFRMDPLRSEFASAGPWLTYRQLRHLVTVLAARARYEHAEQADPQSAWRHLKAILSLSKAEFLTTCSHPHDTLSRTGLCLDVLRHMVLDESLPTHLIADINRALAEASDVGDRWTPVILRRLAPGHGAVSCFTGNGEGNGWLVLSDQTWVVLTRGAPEELAEWSRSPLWNIASIVFNDRRAVERKLTAQIEHLRAVPSLDYSHAMCVLKQLEERSTPLNILDGPVGLFAANRSSGNRDSHLYQLALSTTARVGAVRVLIALNRYCSVNGDYPNRLNELVPDFLDVLPVDPFCGQSFGYRVEVPGRVLLYSCGYDGDDGGGKSGSSGDGRPSNDWENGDYLFTAGREEPRSEPSLVPVSASGSITGGTNSDGAVR